MDARDTIKTFLAGKIPKEVKDCDDIFELGLVDSLFGLQLVNFVEQTFGFEVDGDDLDLENFCSIDALTRFVTGKTGMNQAA